jgi:ATP-binding cassette subfamily C (CFTR/MRP) protein 4
MLPQLIVSLSLGFVFFGEAMAVATRLHNTMLLHVVLSPLAFYFNNSCGRILNRFSRDVSLVSCMLPLAIYSVLESAALVLG